MTVADDGRPLARWLDTLDHVDAPSVGPKAMNLGRMAQAGIPVPTGFCLTIPAADSPSVLPEPVVEAVTAAFTDLAFRGAAEGWGAGGSAPLAVRSSATGEDSATLSYAGLYTTVLGATSLPDVLEAVSKCWASRWDPGVVAYERHRGVQPGLTRLAVIVQRMIEPTAAGVLCTADPVTGSPGVGRIEAVPGLGDRVAAGTAVPDVVRYRTGDGTVLENLAGDQAGGCRRRCVADADVDRLAALGRRVQDLFGSPQQVEFALEGEKVWALQARSLSHLLPMPSVSGATRHRGDGVYLSAGRLQGVPDPLTPMGLQALRLLGAAGAARLGYPCLTPLDGPGCFVEVGYRLFVDVTVVLRDPLGRRLFPEAISRLDPLVGAALRVAAPTAAFGSMRRSARVVAAASRRAVRPSLLARALLTPRAVARRTHQAGKAAAGPPRAVAPVASIVGLLDEAETVLLSGGRRVAAEVVPAALAGVFTSLALRRVLGEKLSHAEGLRLRQGLRHDPTAEMAMSLCHLARLTRGDALSAPTADLVAAYRRGALPAPVQFGLADFLDCYGHRAVHEIDVGSLRWSEDPSYVIDLLRGYVTHGATKDTHLAAGRDAEDLTRELRCRVARMSRLRSVAVGFLAGRARELLGLREAPKFWVSAVIARARDPLLRAGGGLVADGLLTDAEDIFFLTLPEARLVAAGTDLRGLVQQRRADYEAERRRVRVPGVLRSDGTEVRSPGDAQTGGNGQGTLWGTAASPGRVMGPVRVLREPLPTAVRRGEILVAPATDPSWTPLFLIAGGLAVDAGGVMSHGAVVARELGLPAVVALGDASRRLRTGQQIRLDGSAGTLTVLDEASADPVPGSADDGHP